MQEFLRDMRIAKRSPATIEKRLQLLERLRAFLAHRSPPVDLLDADTAALRAFQSTFSNRAPATVDIYTRHMQAFFRWAAERELIGRDPSSALSRPRVPRGQPHPIQLDDLRILFAATTGTMRLVFALAVFAGLRRGEICRLTREEMFLDRIPCSALVHGKGGKDRKVVLLPPLLRELEMHGLPRRGYLVTDRGRPYEPERLTHHCRRHLHGLGLDTTLHSGRHTFATHGVELTHDVVLMQQLMGHASLDTTMIYVRADMSDAERKLAPLSTLFDGVRLGQPTLRVVGE